MNNHLALNTENLCKKHIIGQSSSSSSSSPLLKPQLLKLFVNFGSNPMQNENKTINRIRDSNRINNYKTNENEKARKEDADDDCVRQTLMIFNDQLQRKLHKNLIISKQGQEDSFYRQTSNSIITINPKIISSKLDQSRLGNQFQLVEHN